MANTIIHIPLQKTEFLSPVSPYRTTNDTPNTIHRGYSNDYMDQDEFSYNPLFDVLQKASRGRLDRRRFEMNSRGRYKNIGERPILAIPTQYNLSKLGTSLEEGEDKKWTPTKNLKMTKDLTFTDFTGSGKEFNHREGITLSFEHKVLLDNLFIAAKRQNIKHTIACTNGFAHILSGKKPTAFYVLYTSKQPGIYATWAEVANIIKQDKSHRF